MALWKLSIPRYRAFGWFRYSFLALGLNIERPDISQNWLDPNSELKRSTLLDIRDCSSLRLNTRDRPPVDAFFSPPFSSSQRHLITEARGICLPGPSHADVPPSTAAAQLQVDDDTDPAATGRPVQVAQPSSTVRRQDQQGSSSSRVPGSSPSYSESVAGSPELKGLD